MSLVKVWPSSSPRWRWPSRRWPSTSWKKTAEARPERMAGPSKGSVTGALRSASRLLPSSRMAASSSACVGRPSTVSASKVCSRKRSMPSSARVTATTTSARQHMRRDDARPFGGGEVIGLVLDGEQDHVLVHVRIFAEDAATVPSPAAPMPRGRWRLAERRRRCASAVPRWLKSGEVSSSLARTWASVFTRR